MKLLSDSFISVILYSKKMFRNLCRKELLIKFLQTQSKNFSAGPSKMIDFKQLKNRNSEITS